MDKLGTRTTAVGAFALASVNLLVAFGLVLPAWASAAAVSLVNAAMLGVVGAIAGIKHLVETKAA